MKLPLEQMRPFSEDQTSSFLACIVESSDDAIFAMTLDGTFLTWNKAAEEMYGYAAAEIIGKPVFLLAPPDRLSEMSQNLERLARGDRVPHFETTRLTKNQTARPVSVCASLVRDRAGQSTAAAVIARDITLQKRAEREAELANRVKNQFLDNMSHEFRTPMNGILGMTELVLGTELTPQQREDLGLVKLSTESLLAAVDDILDFSRIDTGNLRIESIPFDFRECIDDTMKMLGFRAQNMGLELVYDIAPEIPSELLGDPGRIRRVLYNLIGNAIKFTPLGEVFVAARQEAREGDSICVRFAVKDTGIGISPEKQQHIFEPFTQADSSSTRKYGGTGLGLAIAKRTVELMQGRIWVESELDKGSTFYFTAWLNAQDNPAKVVPPIDRNGLRDLHVLIVDDNMVSRRVLRGMLTRWGLKATEAEDAPSALQALRIAKDIGHPFPLVLLEGQLRGMDGFSLAERIKNAHEMCSATVMMLTSVGHVGDAARCRGLGVDAYLVKPIGHNELANAICLALERSGGQEATPLVTRHSLREARHRLPSEL